MTCAFAGGSAALGALGSNLRAKPFSQSLACFLFKEVGFLVSYSF